LRQESLDAALELGDKWGIAKSLSDGAIMPGQEGDPLSLRRSSLFKALELFRETGDLYGEADVLLALGAHASNHGKLDEGVALLEQSLAVSRELDNPEGIAFALVMLADAASERGDLAQARAFAEESLQLTRRLGEPGRESLALALLGDVARLQGDYEQSHQVLAESLRIGRDCFWAHESDALRRIGLVCIDEGNFDGAREHLLKNLALRWEHRDGQLFYDLQLLGMMAAAEGAHKRAARVLGASEKLREERGFDLSPSTASELGRWVSRLRDELDDETLEREWAAGRGMSEESAVAYVLASYSDEDAEGRP
jgi:tetratricopeptide (TPR) repeat protein